MNTLRVRPGQGKRRLPLSLVLLIIVIVAGIFVGLPFAASSNARLLAAPLSQTTGLTASQPAVVRPGGATLHSEPDGELGLALSAGTMVTALGRTEDSGWVLVETQDGASGWISGASLVILDLTGLPVVEPSDVSADPAASPSEPAPTIALPAITPTPEATATPSATAVAASPVTSLTPQPTSAGQTGQLAIAGATGATLLDAPDGVPLHQLGPGVIVYLFARTAGNGWVQAQRADDPAQSGWIATSQLYLSNLAALPEVDGDSPVQAGEDAPSNTSEPAPASADATLEVIIASDGDRLNVRSGPGTNYPVIAKALDGETYTALGRDANGDWLQIDTTAGNAARYEVATGWIAAEFVRTAGEIVTLPVLEAGTPPAAPPASATPQPTPLPRADPGASLLVSATNAQPVAGLTGTLVFQTSPGGLFYAHDLAAGSTWPLTTGFDPAISPDGKTVAFVREGGENGIYLIDIDGSNERRIFSGAARLSSPKWSPDGNWIVFTRGNEYIECRQIGFGCIEEGSLPPGFEVDDEEMPLVRQYSYVLSRVDRNGENYRDIPSLASARAADWNEAGIVYQSNAGLQITDDTPDAENRLLIFDFLKPHFADPDWQPNGGRIAYMGREASHHEIFTVNPDGSGVTALTRPATALVDEIPANVAPAWSPDGQHIVFLSNRDEGGEAGEWRIWVMEADGSNQRPLPIDIPITYTYGGEQAVSWGPSAR